MIIPAASLTKSRWKNGGGVTTEVIRVCQTTDASDSAYDWRASFAEVRSNGPFSTFPGYDRALIVWDGDGLYLNGSLLSPLEPIYFAGEETIMAELRSGAVQDFGVIFRRDDFTCRLEVVRSSCEATDLLFVVSGKFVVGGKSLAAQDSWTGAGQVELASKEGLAIRATLMPRKTQRSIV